MPPINDPSNIVVADNLPEWMLQPDVKYAEEGYSAFGPALGSGYHTPYMSQALVDNGIFYAPYSQYTPGVSEYPFIVASSPQSYQPVGTPSGVEAWPEVSYYYTFDWVQEDPNVNPGSPYYTWERLYDCNFAIPVCLDITTSARGIGSDIFVVMVSPIRADLPGVTYGPLGDTQHEVYFLEAIVFQSYYEGPVTRPEVLASSDYATRSLYSNCREVKYAVHPSSSTKYSIVGDFSSIIYPGSQPRHWNMVPLGKRFTAGVRQTYSSTLEIDVWHLDHHWYGNSLETYERKDFKKVEEYGLSYYGWPGISQPYHGSTTTYDWTEAMSGDRWPEEIWSGCNKSYIDTFYYSGGNQYSLPSPIATNQFGKSNFFGSERINPWARGHGDRTLHGAFGWDFLRKKCYDDRDEWYILNTELELEELFYVDYTYNRKGGDNRVFDVSKMSGDGGFMVTTYLLGQEDFTEEFYWSATSGSLLTGVGGLKTGSVGSEDSNDRPEPKYRKPRLTYVRSTDDPLNGPIEVLSRFGYYSAIYGPGPYVGNVSSGLDFRVNIMNDDWTLFESGSIFRQGNNGYDLGMNNLEPGIQIYWESRYTSKNGGDELFAWDFPFVPDKQETLWLRLTQGAGPPTLYYSRQSPFTDIDSVSWISLGSPDDAAASFDSQASAYYTGSQTWTAASNYTVQPYRIYNSDASLYAVTIWGSGTPSSTVRSGSGADNIGETMTLVSRVTTPCPNYGLGATGHVTGPSDNVTFEIWKYNEGCYGDVTINSGDYSYAAGNGYFGVDPDDPIDDIDFALVPYNPLRSVSSPSSYNATATSTTDGSCRHGIQFFPEASFVSSTSDTPLDPGETASLSGSWNNPEPFQAVALVMKGQDDNGFYYNHSDLPFYAFFTGDYTCWMSKAKATVGGDEALGWDLGDHQVNQYTTAGGSGYGRFNEQDGTFVHSSGVIGSSGRNVTYYDWESTDFPSQDNLTENSTYSKTPYSGVAIINNSNGVFTDIPDWSGDLDLCVGVKPPEHNDIYNSYIPLASSPGNWDFWVDSGVLHWAGNTSNGYGTVSWNFHPNAPYPWDYSNSLETFYYNSMEDYEREHYFIWFRTFFHSGGIPMLLIARHYLFYNGGWADAWRHPQYSAFRQSEFNTLHTNLWLRQSYSGAMPGPLSVSGYPQCPEITHGGGSILKVGVANGAWNSLMPVHGCFITQTNGVLVSPGLGIGPKNTKGFILNYAGVDNLGVDEWSGFSGTNPGSFNGSVGGLWLRDLNNTFHFTDVVLGFPYENTGDPYWQG